MNHMSEAPSAEPIPVAEEGSLRITLLADDGAVVRLECEGHLHADALVASSHLLADILGPECYRRKVLVNLEKTSSLDSSGVGWLIATQKRFAANGGRWVLHSLPPWVKQMLHLLHLDSFLQLAADEATACRLVRGAVP